MKQLIATAVALGLATASVAAIAQDKKSFDPYSQGAKAGEKFDTYSQGAKSGDKFDPYSQGANKSTRADLTDQSTAAPKQSKSKKAPTKKPAQGN
ncbi:amino acid ABC transporter permease [Cupriavidus sp. D384]|uniref:amino acid ABC transporter permease n=1 Tax=Cupriavidus sp. D384 TaxID=1538095 RepID=UPI00082DE3F8|nr:amino acid ABC transporter permease [Cupriavidus sp. D384]